MSIEMCGESIFIADKSNVPYICSNKLNRKRMKQRVVYLAISLLATSSLTAQEAKKWTLNDCIEYALERISSCNRIKFHWKKVMWM